ncbi:hypothetical protein SLA2020_172670 [Shorea laevis]
MISTARLETISKVQSIKINRSFYSIKVVEEEVSNCFFSMLSDKRPAEVSSDDEESSYSLENSEEWGLEEEANIDSHWEGWKLEDDDVEPMHVTRDADKSSETRAAKGSLESKVHKECQSSDESNFVELPKEHKIGGLSGFEDLSLGKHNMEPERTPTKVEETSLEAVESSERDRSKDGDRENTEGGNQNSKSMDREKACGLSKKSVASGLEDKNLTWASEQDKNKEAQNKETSGPEISAWRCLSVDETVESNGFWRGLESEDGMSSGRKGRGDKRQIRERRNRAKSCAAVYKDSKKAIQSKGDKRRGRPNRRVAIVEAEPVFLQNLNKQVAGESISDGGIANCNKRALTGDKIESTTSIWEFAKAIGVEAQGSEIMVLKKLEMMEKRDKKLQLKKKAANNGKEGTGIILN